MKISMSYMLNRIIVIPAIFCFSQQQVKETWQDEMAFHGKLKISPVELQIRWIEEKPETLIKILPLRSFLPSGFSFHWNPNNNLEVCGQVCRTLTQRNRAVPSSIGLAQQCGRTCQQKAALAVEKAGGVETIWPVGMGTVVRTSLHIQRLFACNGWGGNSNKWQKSRREPTQTDSGTLLCTPQSRSSVLCPERQNGAAAHANEKLMLLKKRNVLLIWCSVKCQCF